MSTLDQLDNKQRDLWNEFEKNAQASPLDALNKGQVTPEPEKIAAGIEQAINQQNNIQQDGQPAPQPETPPQQEGTTPQETPQGTTEDTPQTGAGEVSAETEDVANQIVEKVKSEVEKLFVKKEEVIPTAIDDFNPLQPDNTQLISSTINEPNLLMSSDLPKKDEKDYIRQNKALEIENKLLRDNMAALEEYNNKLLVESDRLLGTYRQLTANLDLAQNAKNGIKPEWINYNKEIDEEILNSFGGLQTEITKIRNKRGQRELQDLCAAEIVRMGLNNHQVIFVQNEIAKDVKRWYKIVKEGPDFLRTAIETVLKNFKEQEEKMVFTQNQLLENISKMLAEAQSKKSKEEQARVAKPSIRETQPVGVAPAAPQPLIRTSDGQGRLRPDQFWSQIIGK